MGTLQLGDARVDEAALAELCQRYHVGELAVFGSAARGDMRQDRDIDLGRRVDLVPKNGLKPLMRTSVLEAARLLYAT